MSSTVGIEDFFLKAEQRLYVVFVCCLKRKSCSMILIKKYHALFYPLLVRLQSDFNLCDTHYVKALAFDND